VKQQGAVILLFKHVIDVSHSGTICNVLENLIVNKHLLCMAEPTSIVISALLKYLNIVLVVQQFFDTGFENMCSILQICSYMFRYLPRSSNDRCVECCLLIVSAQELFFTSIVDGTEGSKIQHMTLPSYMPSDLVHHCSNIVWFAVIIIISSRYVRIV
jgi:hypothetical protein